MTQIESNSYLRDVPTRMPCHGLLHASALGARHIAISIPSYRRYRTTYYVARTPDATPIDSTRMGNCCACLTSAGAADGSSVEMKQRGGGANGGGGGGGGKMAPSLTVSRRMSAQSVAIDGEMVRVSGNGLALVGCSIEQDASYWEWQIERTGGGGSADDGDDDDETNAPKFGVATKKDQKFYRALQAAEIDDNEMSGDDGTALMRSVSVRDGDTVGVAVQQSDLPMIQFLLNGEPLHDIAINRFRGAVFPAIYVREGIKAEVVFDEDNFKELSPHARFGPLIAARGII